MARPRVVIVHLGRARATGEERRVESWVRLFDAAGAEVHRVPLVGTSARRLPSPSRLLEIASGTTAPEAVAWSGMTAQKTLSSLDADLVLCITTRAYDPAFWKVAPVVLDFVDSLGQSYQQRATVADSLFKRAGYWGLARMQRRLEVDGRLRTLRRVAAGSYDARALGAEWVPIVAWDFRQTDPETADHDFVFVGNLGYLPNIAAVRFLAEAWPEVQARRPGATLVVAGRQPAAEVESLARRHRWTLVPDFEDIFNVLGRGRVALAPVEHLSGISTKILDAAAMGVAQVVTPAALRGVAEGFPAVVADGPAAFAREAVDLLDDEPRRSSLASAARTLMQSSYSVEAWRPWVAELLRSVPRRAGSRLG